MKLQLLYSINCLRHLASLTIEDTHLLEVSKRHGPNLKEFRQNIFHSFKINKISLKVIFRKDYSYFLFPTNIAYSL